MKIIGIAGPPCSGKDTAAEYIEHEYGFQHISTGDLLREKARRLNIDLGRTSLQLLGSRLRLENNGKDPLLGEALSKVKVDTVFTGIRTVDAAQTILDLDDSTMLYIEAPIKNRYDRSLTRGRRDHKSYEEFLSQDKIEYYGDRSVDTSLLAVRGMAKTIIINDESLTNFVSKIDNFIYKAYSNTQENL